MQQPSLPHVCGLRELPDLWQAWREAGATGLVVLLGQPVAHSVSPAMHQAAFAAAGRSDVYIACDVAPDDLAEALALLARIGAHGCNVTIPHKEAALARASAQTRVAAAVGAANCLTRRGDTWHAANTDVPGLVAALQVDHGLDLRGQSGAVIGTGGFARAAVAALLQAGCTTVTVLGRRPEAAAALAADLGPAAATLAGGSDMRDARVIGLPLHGREADRALAEAAVCVNATPAGMWPHVEDMPLDPERLGDRCFLYDSIYKPATTRLLQEAATRGLNVANGLSLLVRQGAMSWQYWFGADAPVTAMWEAAAQAL